MMPQEINNSSQTAEATGEKTITGETETLKEEYTTTDSDKSAILVENGGNATIEGATISKTGGDSTNTENSEFYGINSGILVTQNSTATVTNSTLTASGTGNRGETDQAGIMIYQSMSGDAGEGTGTFTATNSNLSIQANSKYYKTAPMFFITNTDAIINLKNCQLTYGSNTLISNKGTTEWGTTGTNGGNLTLNAENQTLKGNIEIDNISTLKMNLTNSQYTGTINGEQTAKQIDIKIDSNTKIKLTGNSYVTSLEDEDTTYSNIDFNGYTLYVNGTAIN